MCGGGSAPPRAIDECLGAAPEEAGVAPVRFPLTTRKVKDCQRPSAHQAAQPRRNSLMGNRIIILGGCGAMGSEATRDLARTSDFEEIVIADADLIRAQALAAELGGGRVRATAIDVSDEAALTEGLRG